MAACRRECVPLDTSENCPAMLSSPTPTFCGDCFLWGLYAFLSGEFILSSFSVLVSSMPCSSNASR